jgi:hypothetical protein
MQEHLQNINATSFSSNYNFGSEGYAITNASSAPTIAKNQGSRPRRPPGQRIRWPNVHAA